MPYGEYPVMLMIINVVIEESKTAHNEIRVTSRGRIRGWNGEQTRGAMVPPRMRSHDAHAPAGPITLVSRPI